MQRLIGILLLLCSGPTVKAQPGYDSSFHFYYYDQKLSMFETMKASRPAAVWLGDSITDGCEWTELFPGKKMLNRGISADNTFGILNRLHEIIRRHPRKVFIMIGINDIARGIPDSIILRNYRRIIDSFRQQAPQTRLIFQSLLPTNNTFTDFKNHQNKTEHILYVNRELESICHQYKIGFINLYPHFTDEEGRLDARYTNDGLHLTGAGYLKWKEIILQGKYL